MTTEITNEIESPIKPLSVLPQNTMPGFGSVASFELMQRAARMLSVSTMIPKIYQDDISNCAIALNIALRMGADPLMVMQNLYIVNGKPGWSSAFLIATFNMNGSFGKLRFEFGGERGKDDWSCRAWAVDRETGEKVYGSTISILMAKAEGWYGKDGSKWKTIPEQMLMYRAAAFFIRAYAPEISLGLQTTDELQDAFETVSVGDGTFEVVASAGRHPAQAAIDKAQPEVDINRRENIIADLSAKAEEGVEALDACWLAMDEDTRMMVGLENFDRIKKLAETKAQPKAE